MPSQRCGAMFGNGLAGDCVARWVGKNGSMFNQQGVVKHGGLTRKNVQNCGGLTIDILEEW